MEAVQTVHKPAMSLTVLLDNHVQAGVGSGRHYHELLVGVVSLR